MGNEWNQEERRRHPRIRKHFILTYYSQERPTDKHDMSQLKDISMGGVCFMTSQRYEPSTKLILELKTPYLAETTRMEGTVVDSREKLADILYETRLKFAELSPQAKVVLEKIVKHFKEGEQL